MTMNQLTGQIISAAIDIHKTLGPGLLESAYKECMFYEITQRGLYAEKEKPLPLVYNSVHLDIGYRIDLHVENKIIIEVKSVDSLNNIHLAQILTYLKLSDLHLGLLINFNVSLLKNGIKRVVNGYP